METNVISPPAPLAGKLPAWITPLSAGAWKEMEESERRAVLEVSPANPAASLQARRLLARWPSFEAFAAHFSLQNLTSWPKAPNISGFDGRTYCLVATNAPTLGLLSDMFGADKAGAWIAVQLYNLVKLFTVDGARKPTAEVIRAVADSWVQEYPHGKVTELWVFFAEVLAGSDGQQTAYGSIELANLGKRYRAFIDRRNVLVSQWTKKIERMKERKEMERRETEARYHAPTEEDKSRMLAILRSRNFGRKPPIYQLQVKAFCEKYGLIS